MYGDFERVLSSKNKFLLVMSLFKVKINVNLPQLLSVVVIEPQNAEFGRFEGFCVDCCFT